MDGGDAPRREQPEDPARATGEGGRPEGRRTTSSAASAWRLLWQAVGVVAVYALTLYTFDRAPRSMAAQGLRIAFGAVAILTIAWAVESAVMRKFPTLSIGLAAIGLWLGYMVLVEPESRLAVLLGFFGLLVAAVTPPEHRMEADDLEHAFLAAHPRYAQVRRFARGLVVSLVALAFAAAVLSGIWKVLFGAAS